MLIFNTNKPCTHSVSGVISLHSLTMAPDGKKYFFFWAQCWQVYCSEELEMLKLSHSKNNNILAIDHSSKVISVFPEDQVKGWVYCETPPASDCYVFE
ncbi:MAG: hypothetical protein D3925_13015 [Candidatus Electrothrix sp. AR5]|nr:hypothetical protein [Candidatus Electrothrix sp. AR5]